MPRLVLTAGEPAGIGAEIIVKALLQSWSADVMVIGDPDLFSACAGRLGVSLQIESVTDSIERRMHQPPTIRIREVKLRAPVVLGQLNSQNADYVLETLTLANTLLMQDQMAAMVTAPVHKGILSQSQKPFYGHTEFFRDACGVMKTLMLFVTPQFKTALFTTHVPLRDVPLCIQKDALRQTLVLLHDEMRVRFDLASPRVGVCSVNPHAGEGGLLGDEELTVINPVIQELQQAGLAVFGAYPADTIFTAERLSQFDVVLGMYHDQVLPLVKYLGFGSSVNVTLGLPYIRTSVDHGTALDIAHLSQANASSLCQAMHCALDLLTRQHRHGQT